MKKFGILIISLAFIFLLSSCDNNEKNSKEQSKSSSEVVSEVSSANKEGEIPETSSKADKVESKVKEKPENKSLILIKNLGVKGDELEISYTNNTKIELGYFSDYKLFLYDKEEKREIMALIKYDEMMSKLKKGEELKDKLNLKKFFGNLVDGKYILVKTFYENGEYEYEILVKSEFFIMNGEIVLAQEEYKEQIASSKIKEIVLHQEKFVNMDLEQENKIKDLFLNANWELVDYDLAVEDYIKFDNGLRIGILSAKDNSLVVLMQGGVKYLLTDLDSDIYDLF